MVREKREKDAVTFLELNQRLSAQVRPRDELTFDLHTFSHCDKSLSYFSPLIICNQTFTSFLFVVGDTEEMWSHLALPPDCFRRFHSL